MSGYPTTRASDSDLASSFLRIEPCQKSTVGSPTDEWRDRKFTRKIERPMNIEGKLILLPIAFGVHDALPLVVPRFLRRWNGLCQLSVSVETGANSAHPTARNLTEYPCSEDQREASHAYSDRGGRTTLPHGRI